MKSKAITSLYRVYALALLSAVFLGTWSGYAQTAFENEEASGVMHEEGNRQSDQVNKPLLLDSAKYVSPSSHSEPTALMRLIMEGRTQMIYAPLNAIPAKRPEIKK